MTRSRAKTGLRTGGGDFGLKPEADSESVSEAMTHVWLGRALVRLGETIHVSPRFHPGMASRSGIGRGGG